MVIGYMGDSFQIWCCDGLTIQPQGDSFVPSSQAVKKIHRLPSINVLCGWVGEKYDAEMILDGLSSRQADSVMLLVKHAANECQRINRLSHSFCTDRNQVFCPTGLLVGGFLMDECFLASISPEGGVQSKTRFAAIGAGAHSAAKCLREVSTHPLSLRDAWTALIDSVVQASHNSEFVGGYLFTFLITRRGIAELPIVELGEP